MGINCNAQNNIGQTPLHLAFIGKCDFPVIQYILEQSSLLGINCNIQNDYGETVLHSAMKHCNQMIVQFMLDPAFSIDVST